ncbi:MAG: hypothetical protein ABIO76_01485 [Ginsengibacter sp.]
MKKNILLVLVGSIILCFYSCDKSNFDSQGGELPTNYITFRDSMFSPQTLEAANGSSFTFLNQTANPITIAGDDTTLLKSVVIDANSFYFFKPDTIPVVPANINIPYHCVEITSARGTIILRP